MDYTVKVWLSFLALNLLFVAIAYFTHLSITGMVAGAALMLALHNTFKEQ